MVEAILERDPFLKSLSECACWESCKSSPVIADISSFYLEEQNPIFNRTLDIPKRSESARRWEGIGEALYPMFERNGSLQFFSRGTYTALEKSCKDLADTQEHYERFMAPAKKDNIEQHARQKALRENNIGPQIIHDLSLAHRAWSKLRKASYERLTPGNLPSHLQERVREYGLAHGPVLRGVLDSMGVSKYLMVQRVEDLLWGALSLGESSGEGTRIIHRGTFVPAVFRRIRRKLHCQGVSLPPISFVELPSCSAATSA
jgi:hypothetical protein